MFVLDTNVLSELVKPRPNAATAERVLGAPKGSLFASELTRYELRRGAARYANPAHMWARIQALILTVPIWVPVGAEISERTGLLVAGLDRSGTPIGAMDPFIAATALLLGLPIVTHNIRHFTQIEGLEVIDWYVPQ